MSKIHICISVFFAWRKKVFFCFFLSFHFLFLPRSWKCFINTLLLSGRRTQKSNDIIDSLEPWSRFGTVPLKCRDTRWSLPCAALFWPVQQLTEHPNTRWLVPQSSSFPGLLLQSNLCIVCFFMHINQTMSTSPRPHRSSQMPKNVILKGEICHGNQMNLKSDPVQRNVKPAVGLFCDFVIAVYWWEKLYWSAALEFVTLNPPPVPKWL